MLPFVDLKKYRAKLHFSVETTKEIVNNPLFTLE